MNVKRDFFIIGAVLLLSLVGCQAGESNGNGGNNGTDTGNPIPTLSSMNPDGVVNGMPAFTLEVTGSSFVDGARVVFNGTELDTTYVSSTRLTARVSPGGAIRWPPVANRCKVEPRPYRDISSER